jgi:hypothetical protein
MIGAASETYHNVFEQMVQKFFIRSQTFKHIRVARNVYQNVKGMLCDFLGRTMLELVGVSH